MKKIILLSFLVLLMTLTLVSCGKSNTHELEVKGGSMENALRAKDKVLLDMDDMEISRYDVIAFTPYDIFDATRSIEKQEYYIKRIYGLPGETIQIKDNEIYINGKVIKDTYTKNDMGDAGIAENPVILAEDEYFVLGDNRQISQDSRHSDLGSIKQEKVIGKITKRWNEIDSKWIDINE